MPINQCSLSNDKSPSSSNSSSPFVSRPSSPTTNTTNNNSYNSSHLDENNTILMDSPSTASTASSSALSKTWTVIGAGPAGVLMVGQLLQSGVEPAKIAWIDPQFKGGAMGTLYGEVPSNSKALVYGWVVKKQAHDHCHSCVSMLETAEEFPPLAVVGKFLDCMTKDYISRGVQLVYGTVLQTVRSGSLKISSESSIVFSQDNLAVKPPIILNNNNNNNNNNNKPTSTSSTTTDTTDATSAPVNTITIATTTTVNLPASAADNSSSFSTVPVIQNIFVPSSTTSPLDVHSSRTACGWTIYADNGLSWNSDVVVVATGAVTRSTWMTSAGQAIQLPSEKLIALGDALNTSYLKALVAQPENQLIGIVGNSHTAYLVAMVLDSLGAKIRLYAREPGSMYLASPVGLNDMEFYLSDGIKGPVAEFVKEKVLTGNSNVEIFTGSEGVAPILECSKILLAIGFDQKPPLSINGDHFLGFVDAGQKAVGLWSYVNDAAAIVNQHL